MKLNQKGFSAVALLLVLLIIGGVAGTGWYVYSRQKKSDKTTSSQQAQEKTQTEETQDEEGGPKTIKLENAPMVSVDHDGSWSRLKEYGYDRDGLTKTIDGVDFIIRFSRNTQDYDYMNRSAGGAYPAGTLHKEITGDGKKLYIGVVDDDVVGTAFLSTCAPTEEGACSIVLADDYGYLIVDLSRFAPTESYYAASSSLIVGNSADQKAIDEFAQIITTLKTDNPLFGFDS